MDNGWVSIGFANSIGAFPANIEKEALVARMRAARPEKSEGSILNAAGQLLRFYREVQAGDRVTTYDPAQRRYLMGTIAAGDVSLEDTGDGKQSRRAVSWDKRVSRDALSPASRNSLGSTLTLFRLNEDVQTELEAKSVAIDAPDVAQEESRIPAAPETEAVLEEFYGDIEEKAREFIDDLIVSLDPGEMEDLVAGILEAMGYKSRRLPVGPDRGVDVVASPDGLGLEEPRIFVEVKHRKASMGAPVLRAFLGGRKPGDRCLFVSTGGFTREARYEAERSTVPLTLVDLPLLRDMLLEHYENADASTRRLVPLTRVYWPSRDG